MPLFLLSALTIWIAIQLVPLPPDMWHALPGREVIVQADRLLGQSDIWRPISLTPSKTANSLLAMTVPFAALLIFARTEPEDHPKLLMAIGILAVLSAALGLVQIFSGPASAAYLYRITSTDAMVGLFANRNHHAVFLACSLPIVGMLLRDELMRKQQRGLRRNLLALAILALAAVATLIGSRVGLAAAVAAFVITYAMVLSAWRMHSERRSSSRSVARPLAGRFSLYAPPFLMVALLGMGLWFSGRATGLSRLVEQDVAADLRWQAWPTVEAMMSKYWVLGSGFGSFPDVYKMFEPDKLLQPSYFNHAHNDWAEIIITGGVPFIFVLLAGGVWIVRTVMARGTRNLIKGYRGDVRLPALVAIFLLAIASLFDYPLRVPSMQAMTILLLMLLCCPKPAATVSN